MSRKLPADLFEQYVAMGPERSYAALAQRYKAGKRAVAKRASKEGWRERLAQIEQEARKRSDERLADTLEEMRARHRQTIKAMMMRALAGLKEFQLDSAMDAIKAAEITIKLERLIAGEPSERAAIDVAEVTREEMRRLLTVEPPPSRDPGPVEGGSQGGTDGDPGKGDDCPPHRNPCQKRRGDRWTNRSLLSPGRRPGRKRAMEDSKSNEEVGEAGGGAAKLPRLFGARQPGGRAIESLEGGTISA